MRNRWFHAPTLHTPSHGSEKKVSWLELFYDLIFVAAIIQLGNVLADHVGAGGFAIFAALFVPLWVAWAGFTFFMNRFELDDFAHRVTAFGAMFSVGGMAIFAPRVVEGEFRGFALSYATTQATVALMHLRSHAQEPSSRDYSRYWGGVFAIGAVLWGVSVLFPAPYAYGLVFAKVSRPQASALFTSTLTVHPRDGVPTLHLRLGNARGNDVVDANISLTVVRDEITREGEHMRRLTDLALVRSNTPLFRLTWTVMHVIDEQSPLFGVDLEAEADGLLFIAVVRGHDGTYAQTTHARHLYRGADVRVGQRFVDVVSRLPDGRMMVDYDRFHDLEPFHEPGA